MTCWGEENSDLNYTDELTKILRKIARSFKNSSVLYTQHAREEMIREKFGRIKDNDV